MPTVRGVNRMTTLASVNPAYDLAGNLTLAFSEDRNTSYKYRYDHLNRLTGLYDSTNSTRKAAFTYDAFGRRIELANDVTSQTQRYYYDGANEVATFTTNDFALAHWVHGLSYIDERVMMWVENTIPGLTGIQRPYYYTFDRMYNVRALVDRAGALVERYVYDPYGKPLIRESAGRGDHNNDSILNGLDASPFVAARDATSWDPRADLNDDGLVDATDSNSAFVAKQAIWAASSPTVAQAFSDIQNPFMFQGRPNFPIDTALNATSAKNWLNDFRNRFADPTGRWLTRDPIGYADGMNLYEFSRSNPTIYFDPLGYWTWGNVVKGIAKIAFGTGGFAGCVMAAAAAATPPVGPILLTLSIAGMVGSMYGVADGFNDIFGSNDLPSIGESVAGKGTAGSLIDWFLMGKPDFNLKTLDGVIYTVDLVWNTWHLGERLEGPIKEAFDGVVQDKAPPIAVSITYIDCGLWTEVWWIYDGQIYMRKIPNVLAPVRANQPASLDEPGCGGVRANQPASLDESEVSGGV